MTFKLSLALAVLVYFLQIISGVPIDKSLMRSMLYFVVFYTVISINQIIYLHIKLHMIRLEQARREEEKRREREEQQQRVAKTISGFFKGNE